MTINMAENTSPISGDWTDAPPAAPSLASHRYQFATDTGRVLFTSDKLEDVEAFADSCADGTYFIRKILRVVQVTTPEPRRRVASTSLETRPRKPRDPSKKRTRKPAATS